jgi:beta-lactam-binding protein with PASTA domain
MNFQNILNSVKKFFKELYWFLTSGIFLKNFGTMIAIFGGFLMLSLWFTRCYTQHGSTVPVPKLTGLQLDEAKSIAKSKGFSIVIDSSFNVHERPFTILKQNPEENTQVKKNRTLYITINKGNPESVELPSLTGNDDLEGYSRQLSNYGIKTNVIKVFNNKLDPNTILDIVHNRDTITSQVGNGVRVPMGSILTMIVSTRGDAEIGIPNLVCMRYTEAKALLSSYRLSVGTVTKDPTVSNDAVAFIMSQSPMPNGKNRLKPGDRISINLTQARPKGCAADGL